MSDTFSKVEVITRVRRRCFSTDLKLAAVAETMQPGMTISYVARRHGLAPSLVFRRRRRMSEGGKEAVRADDEVVAASEVRRLEDRVRELERLFKTMEVEILKEALSLREQKNRHCCRTPWVWRARVLSNAAMARDRGAGHRSVLAIPSSPARSVALSMSDQPMDTGGSPRSSSASGEPPSNPPAVHNAITAFEPPPEPIVIAAPHFPVMESAL
jgi:transposase